jgi:hypothetical protein
MIMRTVSFVERGPDQCVGRSVAGERGSWGEGGGMTDEGFWTGKGDIGIERGSWFIFIMWVFERIERDEGGNEGSYSVRRDLEGREGTCVPMKRGLFERAHKLKWVLCSARVKSPFPISIC